MTGSKGFAGWTHVATLLRERVLDEEQLERQERESPTKIPVSKVVLDAGQRASLLALADHLGTNGMLIADEVGMGKTRIAAAVAHAVRQAGGRIAIVIPPGLGYQWRDELRKVGGLQDRQERFDVVRSLQGYLKGWTAGESKRKRRFWYDDPIVMVSQAFLSSWRLGDSNNKQQWRWSPRPPFYVQEQNSKRTQHCWRWSLLPHFCAAWRKEDAKKYPRGYPEFAEAAAVDPQSLDKAAQDVAAAIAKRVHKGKRRDPAYSIAKGIVENPPAIKALEPAEIRETFRRQLETTIGLGFGMFDLVILDEAHKGRHEDSALSRLLKILINPANGARRLALTATPVEIDSSDWKDVLSRIALEEPALSEAMDAIDGYDAAVQRLQCSWSTSDEARSKFKKAADAFVDKLSNYVLRRDKREDEAVGKFMQALPGENYRQFGKLTVTFKQLPQHWRRAVLAAEALSFVAQLAQPHQEKSTRPSHQEKLMRLSIGSGHGINAFLDNSFYHAGDDGPKEATDIDSEADQVESPSDPKREDRKTWWRNQFRQLTVSSGESILFTHPGMLVAVEKIEALTSQGHKVLVFGRFTKPMQHLVALLNAREMLRRLARHQSWPQSKLPEDASGQVSSFEAACAAWRRLEPELGGRLPERQTLDDQLAAQYKNLEADRERFRGGLVRRLASAIEGLPSENPQRKQITSVLASLKSNADRVAPLSNALWALLEQTHAVNDDAYSNEVLLQNLVELLDSAADRDEAEQLGKVSEPNTDDSDIALHHLIERINESFGSREGGFARLMNGATSQHARRMMQLAFNRRHSAPQVLVAQSLVGREGLNLHLACRHVVLLHPEWNPAVVEQQIGRVDRKGSRWSQEVGEALNATAVDASTPLPRIEVMSVVFGGTYDEHHWGVLYKRWDNLRAQLHGIVITDDVDPTDQERMTLKASLNAQAPNLSPSRAAAHGANPTERR